MKQRKHYKQLVEVINNSALSHAYLFHGKKGVGKKELAVNIAKRLFCQSPQSEGACQNCTHCKRIDALEFSDVQYIESEGQSIKIEQIRQMKSDVAYSSLEHDKKVYIIDGVEKMSVSAANSLLKFLEEPEQQVYFFLLTTQKESVLPTILSRVQTISCESINRLALQQAYQENGLTVQQSYIMSYLYQDLTEGLEQFKDLDFVTFYEEVISFARALNEQNATAFLMVQTKLATYLTQKEWANIGLDILTVYARDVYLFTYAQQKTPLFNTAGTNNYKIELDFLTKAKEMLRANVSAQLCYEWLAVQIGR